MSISKLEADRQAGKNQVNKRRVKILDTAEKLFLEKGLENVTLSEIAAQAGITRVSLYRYFADRDPIAFEIAARMLHEISQAAGQTEPAIKRLSESDLMLAMIDHFDELRDAYRYLGMFNHLYGDHYPNETLANWFKEQIYSFVPSRNELRHPERKEQRAQVIVLLNTIASFLEQMANRGELMASEQSLPIEEQISIFRNVIQVYLDHIHLQV